MEQTGYVTDITDKKITIRIKRQSACGGNCASCGGCINGAELSVECDYNQNEPVNVGDTVTVIMDNKSFFKNVFFCYGLAALGIIFGAVIGFCVSHNELTSFFGAIIGFVTVAAFLHFFDKRKTDTHSLKYRKKDKQINVDFSKRIK